MNTHDYRLSIQKTNEKIKIDSILDETIWKNTAVAKDFFPVLKTLVVPILPEPISLISFPKNIFVIINPNGMDPNK